MAAQAGVAIRGLPDAVADSLPGRRKGIEALTWDGLGDRGAVVDDASVVSLQVFPGRREPAVKRQEVFAVADFGLQGNHKSRAGSQRQVLLLERETLDELGLEPGALRENITTRGIDLHALGPGSRILIGDTALLEITGYCRPCARLEETRSGLIGEVSGRRGMLARVVADGPIAVGAPIRVVHKAEPQASKLPG